MSRHRRRSLKFDVPSIHRPRYFHDWSHRVTTTLPIGKIIPVEWYPLLPGDTHQVRLPTLSKLTSTFFRPIMDNVYLDIFATFTPLRLLYDKTEEVFGTPSSSQYTNPTFSSFPKLDFSLDSSPTVGSIADYLGLPTYGIISSDKYSVLPFRCYATTYNEYCMNQNVSQETFVNTGETASTEYLNGAAWAPDNYTGMPAPAPRYRDYFSTCLLAPQKGPSVKIPGLSGMIPVFSTGVAHSMTPPTGTMNYSALKFANPSGTSYSNQRYVTSNNMTMSLNTEGPVGDVSGSFGFSNLWAINSPTQGTVNDGTINALRVAFQTQKYYERSAFYGSRLREHIYACYGVLGDDASLQVPQFLGRSHSELHIGSIASTADSADVNDYPVGQFAGTSNTFVENPLRFTYTATEYGIVMYFAMIRYRHLYSQGVSRFWKQSQRTDFFDPLFQNIGMQAVMVDEIDAQIYDDGAGGSVPSEKVFGYQEAWSHYRYLPNRVSGQARPSPGSLGQYWSVADFYESEPSLLDLAFETNVPFDRVLTVRQEPDPSNSNAIYQDPFIVDFNFQISNVSVVPGHSIPGLVDHH